MQSEAHEVLTARVILKGGPLGAEVLFAWETGRCCSAQGSYACLILPVILPSWRLQLIVHRTRVGRSACSCNELPVTLVCACGESVLGRDAGSAGPAVSALIVLHYNMPAFGHRDAFMAGRPAGRTACFCILPMSCLSCFAHTDIRPYLRPCVRAFARWQAAPGVRNMTGTYAMAVAFSQAPRVWPGGSTGTWGPVLTGLWHASAAASSGCQASIWPGSSAGRAGAAYRAVAAWAVK